MTNPPVGTGTKVARFIALILVAWSVWLSLDGPGIARSGTTSMYASPYQCPAPVGYALSYEMRSSVFGTPGLPESVADECRERAIGAGVTIGLFGNVVALLLYFTRPPARHAEPVPLRPAKKKRKPAEQPIQGSEDEAALWNPGLRSNDPPK